jgi:hypothetical protein
VHGFGGLCSYGQRVAPLTCSRGALRNVVDTALDRGWDMPPGTRADLSSSYTGFAASEDPNAEHGYVPL